MMCGTKLTLSLTPCPRWLRMSLHLKADWILDHRFTKRCHQLEYLFALLAVVLSMTCGRVMVQTVLSLLFQQYWDQEYLVQCT